MNQFVPTTRFVTNDGMNINVLNLIVEGIRCGGCVAKIERTLQQNIEVTYARINFSTKRLKIEWQGSANLSGKWVDQLQGLGFKTMPYSIDVAEENEKRHQKFLLKCLAVAGFASGNLMLFSFPLWVSSGIEMTDATRSLFHWVQALIAMPTIIYCGIPFYTSAWHALKQFRTNMDVPISVAIVLTTMISLFETIQKGEFAYFDSSVMLLFFLLIGRYLETRARGKARNAAKDVLHMMQGFATVLHSDNTQERMALHEIEKDMILFVAAGEKIGADGEIISGETEIDTSLITGETLPRKTCLGELVYAGTLNLAAPIKIRVTHNADTSLLAEIIKLMEIAEQSQAKYVTIADKLSGWYTPAVHILAAITFICWWGWLGASWETSLLYSATVLIITCPCALGLAVPVVQVLASSKLMRFGILLKSSSALERLATITHIVFDKTGTLTLGQPELLNPTHYDQKQMQLAASLAVHSKHPLSRAISRVFKGELLPLNVSEFAGNGLEALYEGKTIRLGKAEWSGAETITQANNHALELWLYDGEVNPVRFTFIDEIREDAGKIVKKLQLSHLNLTLLSGDRLKTVTQMAENVGITNAYANVSPVQKTEFLQKLATNGAKVMMVGDGLNDAPALAAAHVSMSPSSAADIAQSAADIVFQGDKLQPVYTAWKIAKFSQILVKQNFALALIYNAVAIPFAMLGFVTPVIAAIAMSSSSVIVILNAMRLNVYDGRK